jgi:hypothetical protein
MAYTPTHTFDIKGENTHYYGDIVLQPTVTFERSDVGYEHDPTSAQLDAVKTFVTAVNTLYGVLKSLKTIHIGPVNSEFTKRTSISGT